MTFFLVETRTIKYENVTEIYHVLFGKQRKTDRNDMIDEIICIQLSGVLWFILKAVVDMKSKLYFDSPMN